MKNQKKIITVAIVIVAISVIYLLNKKIKDTNLAIQESMVNSQRLINESLDKEDSILFNIEDYPDLKPNYSIISNYRNRIKCLNYGNNFKIVYTKINIRSSADLSQIIKFQEAESYNTLQKTYHSLNGKNYKLGVLAEKQILADSIIFKLDGENEELIKNVYNENFISYYMPTSSCSISYKKDGPIDICFGTEIGLFGIRGTYPLIISFYKKQGSVYILFVIPNDKKNKLDINLLKEMMKDNIKK